MISDSQLNFVPPNSPLSIVGALGASFASQVVDLLGQGVGTAPQGIIGSATPFGAPDPGIGGMRPQLDVAVGTTFVTSDAATLNVKLQYAADTGAGGGYQPSTWYTAVDSDALPVGELVAGAVIARWDWMPNPPVVGLRVRYVRLLFTTASGTQFTAGAIGFAIVTLVRDDQANKLAGKNFTV